MLSNKIKNGELYNKIRLIYSCVYVTVFFLYSFLPFKMLIGDKLGWLYTSIAVIGLLVLAFDFFVNRQMFKIPFLISIVLFFCSNVITIILNAKYGMIGNIKELLWMGVQIFLLATVFVPMNNEKSLFSFSLLSNIFIFLQTMGAFISFVQFLIGYGEYREVFAHDVWGIKRIGFVESRLFGIYTDPNYACVLAFVAIGFILINICKKDLSKWLNIYYIASIVLQVCYIVLSGSRTGYLALLIVVFFAGAAVVVIKFLLNKKTFLKILCFVLAGLICSSAVGFLFQGAKKGLAYLPSIYSSINNDKNSIDKNSNDKNSNDKNGNEAIKPPVNLLRDDVDNSEDISNNRFKIWKDYLTVFRKSPVFGIGSRTALDFAEDNFDNLYILKTKYSFHNGYLALLVASGIVGAILMLYWLVRVVIYILGFLIRRHKTRDVYYWPIFICTCILLIQAISAFPLIALFYSNQISDILFWVTLGFTFTFISLSEPGNMPKNKLLEKRFRI